MAQIPLKGQNGIRSAAILCFTQFLRFLFGLRL